jgi:hypothetical protein
MKQTRRKNKRVYLSRRKEREKQTKKESYKGKKDKNTDVKFYAFRSPSWQMPGKEYGATSLHIFTIFRQTVHVSLLQSLI